MRLPSDIMGILSQPVEQRGRNRIAALQRRYAESLGTRIDGLRAASSMHTRPSQALARPPSRLRIASRTRCTGRRARMGTRRCRERWGRSSFALERLLAEGENEDECWRLIEVGLDRAARSIE